MPDADDSLQRFYRRLWQQRILPSLSHEQQDKQLHRTRQTARWASAGGRFIDSLLGLRGRPFTRALTSLGVDLSLPKTWDWNWVPDNLIRPANASTPLPRPKPPGWKIPRHWLCLGSIHRPVWTICAPPGTRPPTAGIRIGPGLTSSAARHTPALSRSRRPIPTFAVNTKLESYHHAVARQFR
jgi:hypothetical protein